MSIKEICQQLVDRLSPRYKIDYLSPTIVDDSIKRDNLYFHGTKSQYIHLIIKNGFDENKIGTNTGNLGYYGKGFYFLDSDGFQSVLNYSEAQGNSREDKRSILICTLIPAATSENTHEFEKNSSSTHGCCRKNIYHKGPNSIGWNGFEYVSFSNNNIKILGKLEISRNHEYHYS